MALNIHTGSLLAQCDCSPVLSSAEEYSAAAWFSKVTEVVGKKEKSEREKKVDSETTWNLLSF